MSANLTERRMKAIIEQTESVLDLWRYAAAANGSLWIRPSGPSLSPRDLGGFLRLLADVCRDDPPSEVVFDLEDVDYIGPRWTVAMAMLVEFAQSLPTDCYIASAHGQPAAVTALYRNNRKVAEMVRRRQRKTASRQSA